MYCKYCGNRIPDDSVFCSSCGKLLVESYPNKMNDISPETPTGFQMVNTNNLQWKKPYLARAIQIILISFAISVSAYCIFCIIDGGIVDRHFAESKTLYSKNSGTWQFRETRQYEEYIIIHDFWNIFRVSDKKWNEPKEYTMYGEFIPWAFTYDEIESKKRKYQSKVLFIGIVPSILLLWITILWSNKIKFPTEKDGLPRDIADEIEKYIWCGFSKYKLVFYKKNGKYGIIDARNYCVCVAAQYDSIVWRVVYKTVDVTIGENKKTLNLAQMLNKT